MDNKNNEKFLKKLLVYLPALFIYLLMAYLYFFKIKPSPELEERYSIAYCRLLCKKAILDHVNLTNGTVLSDIYPVLKFPISSTLKGKITQWKEIRWKWNYSCCIGECNRPAIILDENCTFVRKTY